MALLQSLRERLVAYFVSNGNPSVYERIVDQLEDLQRFHQELLSVRTASAESGVVVVREDPKTFESKQKEALEGVENETLELLKRLSSAFEDTIYADNNCQIIKSRGCIVNHIKEIELQTGADFRVIVHYARYAMDECLGTREKINEIAALRRGGEVKKANKKTVTKNMAIVEKQLEHQNGYYEDIINELKNKVSSVQKENQKTFAAFSQITSNAMSLQMKCDCIQTVRETCSETYIKVSDFKETCRRTGRDLDLKIERCKSEFSLTDEKWSLVISEWDALRVQLNETSNRISENINECIETNNLFDDYISQKNKELNELNSDYKTVCRSKRKMKKIMCSGEANLDNVNRTLTKLVETKNAYEIRVNQQDTNERKLLASLKHLDEKIDRLNNTKIDDFDDAVDDHISNYAYAVFDLASSEDLKSSISIYEGIAKQIDELDIEKNELRRSGDAYVDGLKREAREKEENQRNIMSTRVNDRRLRLLDSSNKEMENVEVRIPRCKHLVAEAVAVKNGIDDSTKVLLACLQNMMVDNHGKTMHRLEREREEMSADNDELRNSLRADTGPGKMEALLEERIQLLQDRMKTISAQRQQIEQANRGLEEELDKLSKKFVNMEKNIKVTDTTTEEEKIN